MADLQALRGIPLSAFKIRHPYAYPCQYYYSYDLSSLSYA